MSKNLSRYVVILFSGILVIAVAFTLTTIPYGRAIHDLFVLLDGAYRISVGQMPHVDFASPIGPLLLFVMRAGQILIPVGNGFVAYHAVMWCLTLPALIMLASRFQSNLSFLSAFGLFVLIMLLPMTLDDTYLSEISYFATYNRFASGLLFLLGLWYVLPKSRRDGPLLAYIVFLLFFLKITAAIVAFGIILAACILGRARLRSGLEMLVILAVAFGGIQVTTGLLSGYLHDIATMIAINESSGIYALFYYGFSNWLVLALTGLLVLAGLVAFIRKSDINNNSPVALLVHLWREEAFLVDLLLLVVAAWGAESQNTGGLGLIAAAAILFHPASWDGRRLLSGLLLASMLFPILNMAVKRTGRAIAREQIAAPVQPLEKLAPGTRVPLSTYEGALFFTGILRDRLDEARKLDKDRFFLIHDPTSMAPAAQLARHMQAVDAARVFEERGYRSKAEHYSSLVFSDPFARMLGLMPAKGTMLTMDLDRTVPRFTVQQARDYLKNSDGVFSYSCNVADVRFDLTFAPVLEADFDAYPLNDCWTFHARK